MKSVTVSISFYTLLATSLCADFCELETCESDKKLGYYFLPRYPNSGHFTDVFLEMADARERTFIMVKPDGVQRGLVGEIIKRFEQKGFKLVAMKFMWPSKDLLEKHYADLSSRPFFPGLIQYMSSGPVVPMVWEGLNVVKTGRVMLGATDPKDSAPGTIRGDLCIQVGRNVIHGSDAVESARKEINLWFKPEELFDWKRETEKWIYEN